MKKVILTGTAGMLVFLVVGSLAMAQTPEGIPEGWREYLIQKNECLTVLAVRVPGVDKSNMMWAAEGIARVNGIGQDRIDLIYAWDPIYLPESVEALAKALREKIRIVPEKRAGPTKKELRSKVGLLEEIVGDQSVVLEEMKATRSKLENRVSELENVNLWYWRGLILTGLLIVFLGVILGVAIKSEVKRGEELEEAEKDNEQLGKINAAIGGERDKLRKRLNTIKGLSLGSILKRKGEEFEIVGQIKKPEKDIYDPKIQLTKDEIAKEEGKRVKHLACGTELDYISMQAHLKECKKRQT